MNYFLIDEIKKRRTRNGKKEILVTWQGYEDLMPEWIPENSLEDFQKK
jgi:Trm5-related predicted tRNA methylase